MLKKAIITIYSFSKFSFFAILIVLYSCSKDIASEREIDQSRKIRLEAERVENNALFKYKITYAEKTPIQALLFFASFGVLVFYSVQFFHLLIYNDDFKKYSQSNKDIGNGFEKNQTIKIKPKILNFYKSNLEAYSSLEYFFNWLDDNEIINGKKTFVYKTLLFGILQGLISVLFLFFFQSYIFEFTANFIFIISGILKALFIPELEFHFNADAIIFISRLLVFFLLPLFVFLLALAFCKIPYKNCTKYLDHYWKLNEKDFEG